MSITKKRVRENLVVQKDGEDDNNLKEKRRLSSPTIYEIISKEGREELERPFQSLAWSALVAGICICFSLFCEGFIKLYAPAGTDFFLVENLGYTVGFLIVVIGRFQLFTENTITVILPLLEKFSLSRFFRVMKLWGIVMSFNLIGTFLIAVLITAFPFFREDQMAVFMDVSRHAIIRDYDEIFIQAIPAGFLIATLVWMLPSAEKTKFWIILLMTYVIAIGDFTHVVAGSAEAFLLMIENEISNINGLMYILLACLGNIVGGTGLFAVMAYAQVREEM